MPPPGIRRFLGVRSFLQLTIIATSLLGGMIAQKYVVPKLGIGPKVQRLLGTEEKPATSSKPVIESYWVQRTDLFAALPGQPDPDIVMLGDSLTDNAEWSEIFPSVRILNRGIGGDTTEYVLKRLDEVLSLKPGKVFLMIGINDLGQKIAPGQITSQTQEILLRIKESGAEPVYQSLLHTSDPGDASVKIREINTAMKGFCRDQGIRFVDLNRVMAPDGHLPPSCTNDGIHLLRAGYEQWAETIRPLVTGTYTEKVGSDH